jgi:hypothetical protein
MRHGPGVPAAASPSHATRAVRHGRRALAPCAAVSRCAKRPRVGGAAS